VLRLFRDTLHIGLYADRIVLVRERGLLGRGSRQQHTERVLPNALPGNAALDALQRLLQEPRWRGADARVQLSNSLVYYAIVPASAHLMSAGDEVALAFLKFRQMHGVGAAACDVRLGNLMSGQDQIAAAMESGFVQRLRHILQEADVQLAALEPFLMQAFNRVRRQLVGSDFWFALAEPGLLTLARCQSGSWVSLATSALAGPLARELPVQLQEARLMSGATSDTQRVYLYAPGMDCAGCEASPDLELLLVAEPSKTNPISAVPTDSLALEH